MPDDLYDRDVLIWADRQADLLRRLSAGERVNAEVDWPHVIEELRDVGLAELRACESLLRQAMAHFLKAQGWPAGLTEHWRNEVPTFLLDAQTRFAPSMGQRVDLPRVYAKALREVRGMRIDGAPPGPLPEHCPFTLEDLLAEDVDPAALAARLEAAGA